MSQLRQHEHDLDQLGIRVVVVTFQGVAMAEAYIRETQLPWPILVDESRTFFGAYGMRRGNWWGVWGPASWWVYAKLLLRGRKIKRPAGDVRQLGGDVLIDPQGVVRLHHVGRGPADRPSVPSVLQVVR